MNYKMNRMTNEELSGKASSIVEKIVEETSNSRLDDAFEIIGYAVGQVCILMSKGVNGKVDVDTILGSIYHQANKALKPLKELMGK